MHLRDDNLRWNLKIACFRPFLPQPLPSTSKKTMITLYIGLELLNLFANYLSHSDVYTLYRHKVCVLLDVHCFILQILFEIFDISISYRHANDILEKILGADDTFLISLKLCSFVVKSYMKWNFKWVSRSWQ